MPLDIIRDAEKLLDGPPEHAIALCDALFDAMDPRLTGDEQADAFERLNKINPTAALALLMGFVVSVDGMLSAVSGKRPGELIHEMRLQAPEIIRKEHRRAR
jgi:hypothetical protein